MRSARLFAVAVLAVLLAASMFYPVAAQTTTSRIVIQNETTNHDVTTLFHFDGTGPVNWVCDLHGGDICLKEELAPGDYAVLEVVPPGWTLSISCAVVATDEDDLTSTFSVNLAEHGVAIHLVADSTVICTFTNDPAGPVGGVVMPANTLAIVTPWLAVIGLVGCIGTVGVVAKKRES
ncbi:MAG: hypothetical protein ABSA81_04710 [Candidatus Bathyarchaeia archaeon]|jgi:hypothetical protein